MATVATLLFCAFGIRLIHNFMKKTGTKKRPPLAEFINRLITNTMTVEEPQESARRGRTDDDSLNEPGTAPQMNQAKTKGSRGLGFRTDFRDVLVAMAAIGWFVYKGITSRVSAEKALVVETA